MENTKNVVHPMQPIAKDSHGTLRFVANPIVRDLLDVATKAKLMDMNSIYIDAIRNKKYTIEDQQQFAQLIGYSIGGYSELSGYVNDEAWERVQSSLKEIGEEY